MGQRRSWFSPKKNVSGMCLLSCVDTVTRRKSLREQPGQTHLVNDTSFRVVLGAYASSLPHGKTKKEVCYYYYSKMVR